ncbi:MAG: hypothetical protein JXR81_02305 [Candidatus Goldbacteria bacterium]|nr:hypothetical protein [Candidatus Goldiibacteriota bacterium]
MKKVLIVSFFTFFSICVFATNTEVKYKSTCVKETSYHSSNNKINFNAKSGYKEEYFDSNGIKRIEIVNFSPDFWYEKYFDADGNIYKSKDREGTFYYEMTEEKDSLMKTTIKKDEAGEVIETLITIYDKKGKIKEQSRADNQGNTIKSFFSEYKEEEYTIDSNGNSVLSEYCTIEKFKKDNFVYIEKNLIHDRMSVRDVEKYDGNRLINSISVFFGMLKDISCQTNYYYDTEGRLERSEQLDLNGDLDIASIFEYSFWDDSTLKEDKKY